MQAQLLNLLVLPLVLGATSASYAAGCGDITLCVTNPPNPPDPPLCTKYPNYCSFVQPQIEVAPPKEVIPEGQPQPPASQSPAQPGYSITLNNLSKEQLNKILGQLGVDTGKVKAPQ
jgi:hypothetical protein